MATGRYFINENSLITALFIAKKEKFDVNFVARSEVNLLKTIIKDELGSKNKGVSFTTGVWKKFYDEYEGIITIENATVNLDDLKSYFIKATKDTIPMIWNVDYVYDNVFCRREKLIRYEKSLEDIIDKVLVDPNEFYKNVAGELDYDEYFYLLNKIIDRTCSNCDYDCKRSSICKKWKNDSLVGKMKVLKK